MATRADIHTDSRNRARDVRERFGEMIDRLREDVERVEDPRARALFETSAEVLGGLATACRHYEEGAEAAWRDR